MPDEQRSADRCPACGVRGLSMDRLGGACHALECPDPTAWLRSKVVTKPKPDFDPDLSPENPQNKEAARARRLYYDERARVYRDEDGCIIRDGFGQRL